MHIEQSKAMSEGKDGYRHQVWHARVRWGNGGSIRDIERQIQESGLFSLEFVDHEFFADHQLAMKMCLDMRARGINVLWSAQIATAPSDELFEAMRLAGCQHVYMMLEPDEALGALGLARKYGFDIRICNIDSTPYASDRVFYTVAEREAIVERLPGLHATQFDLALAYFKARRYAEVMLPLGKAMTLRFPANELCLNLLACLSAVRHYPDQAAGLLDQAGYGCPHPVVFRNRRLLKSWLESGGDLRGVRLELEPASSSPACV